MQAQAQRPGRPVLIWKRRSEWHSEVTLRGHFEITPRQSKGHQMSLRGNSESTLTGSSEGTHLLFICLHRNTIPYQLIELLITYFTTFVRVNEAKKHF